MATGIRRPLHLPTKPADDSESECHGSSRKRAPVSELTTAATRRPTHEGREDREGSRSTRFNTGRGGRPKGATATRPRARISPRRGVAAEETGESRMRGAAARVRPGKGWGERGRERWCVQFHQALTNGPYTARRLSPAARKKSTIGLWGVGPTRPTPSSSMTMRRPQQLGVV